MSSVAAPLMLLAMLCAAGCALLDKCRTPASLVCAATMVLGMADAFYTHLLPVAMLAALMATSGLWASLAGWPRAAAASALLLRAHRAASAVVMAWLLLRHTEAMALSSALEDLCTTRGSGTAAPSFAAVIALALLGAGLALTATQLRGQPEHRRALAHSAAALEPMLMGLSLVLMAI
ncbi:hypothetical protein GJ699_00750 [Duganella sp. FT80W]|uniref:Uncharacterized protein n=1 Tax=Duganella guangzhouensis TaxID=2666084 RepID=A0A6I2KS95_9BURK|nr:hypothetical protein [Duganella guangzhouensis]MRW88508.1 hypothetical protein [Duganella guangzhouensis]